MFFEIKSFRSILFSDYLFRGEDDETVVQTAKDVLDIELNGAQVYGNFEKLAGK